MNKKGFTLVELIVSFALISIICVFLFQIVSIISNIYTEKGVKTEIIISRSNISNVINKDIYLNDINDNEIKEIAVISDTEVNLIFKNNDMRRIIVNKDEPSITYSNYTQKFLTGTKIGNIDVDFNYVSGSSLSKNGVLSINIPITYEGYDDTYDVSIVDRFNSSKLVIRR